MPRQNPSSSSTTLREFARSHTSALLSRFAFQVRQAAVHGDRAAIHELRVSIRRLRECLLTFEKIYPARGRKRVRKELQRLMKFAGTVRTADVDLEVLSKSGLADDHALTAQIRERRNEKQVKLREELSALTRTAYTRTWREELGL